MAPPSLESALELLTKLDYLCGTELFEEHHAKTFKRKLYLSLILPSFIITALTLLISTLFVQDFSLTSIIVTTSIAGLCIDPWYLMVFVSRNKDSIKNVLHWCETFYDSNSYPLVMQKVAVARMDRTQKLSLFIMKLLVGVFMITGFMTTVGVAMLNLVLPESVVPKFTLPLPLYLPFRGEATWVTFCLNLILQVKISLEVCLFGSLGLTIFLCIVTHCFAMLDITKETVEMMGDQLLSRRRFKRMKREVLTVDQWTKVIVNQVIQVNQVVSEVVSMYALQFFLHEITATCALLASGFSLVILKEQQLFAIAISTFSVSLFVISRINDKLLEKYSDISNTFYTIPWYELSPKERRSILIGMSCNMIQRGFNAAGFHGVTTEHFTKIVRVAYTNFIALKKVVEK